MTYMSYLFSGSSGAFDDAEDLVLAHDEVFLAVELDLGTAVFPEENAVAFFDIERLLCIYRRRRRSLRLPAASLSRCQG